MTAQTGRWWRKTSDR